MAKSANQSSTQRTLIIAQVGILSALITVMTFVPYLGYISYGGLSITLLHIPVIIGAVVLGPKYGGVLGGVWGITCIIKAVLAPPTPLEGIIFRNPVVALIPRILVGVVAGAVFAVISKNSGKKFFSSGLWKVISSILNSLLIMGAIFGVIYILKKILVKSIVFVNLSSARLVLTILFCALAVVVFIAFYLRNSKKPISAAGIAAILATLTNTVLVMGGIYLFYSKDVGISSISFGGLTNFILTAIGINAVLEIIVGYTLVVPISIALQKVKTKI
jgi:uncharacterized membrane protein